ncbi:MAG TPA: hypothetical protein VEZ90_00560, partial [Blastocatellia bacterium]|nr:hypothetical protein [Blastocatellia bacterium]
MNKTKSRGYIQALVLAIILTLSALTLANQHRRSIARDKQDMIDLENEWLHAHDRTSLERILASDFVHPVPTGDFLTKEQHIAWNVAHPPPAEIRYQFENLTI